MSLEKADQRGEQSRVIRPAPEFVRPNSSQVEEPLRPALVAKRCRKRAKGKHMRIMGDFPHLASGVPRPKLR